MSRGLITRLEKFIRGLDILSSMPKDSDLVIKAEKFLDECKLRIQEMVYTRNNQFNGKPSFEVLTSNAKSLEFLAKRVGVPLRKDYDERSHYVVLEIQQEEFNLSIYSRKSF